MSARWWRRLQPVRRCQHESARCVHGDEIIARGYRRRACLDCGRSLDGPLPEPCSYTDQPHFGGKPA